MRKPSRLRAGLAAAALAAGTTLGMAAAATPASASTSGLPTGCGPGWAGEGATYATASCSGGSGYYREWVYCVPAAPGPWGSSIQRSPWHKPGGGQWAEAWINCPFPDQVQNRGIDLKS